MSGHFFSWNEGKRRSNLRKHRLDSADVWKVFCGPMLTYEDTRFDYGEQRFITLGMDAEGVVSIVHTEDANGIVIISFRRATANETKIFFAEF